MLISIKGDRSAQKRSAHVPAFVASSHGVSTLYDNLTAPYGCETSPNHYDRMLTAQSGDIKDSLAMSWSSISSFRTITGSASSTAGHHSFFLLCSTRLLYSVSECSVGFAKIINRMYCSAFWLNLVMWCDRSTTKRPEPGPNKSRATAVISCRYFRAPHRVAFISLGVARILNPVQSLLEYSMFSVFGR
jgi:hypothetical protein